MKVSTNLMTISFLNDTPEPHIFFILAQETNLLPKTEFHIYHTWQEIKRPNIIRNCEAYKWDMPSNNWMR